MYGILTYILDILWVNGGVNIPYVDCLGDIHFCLEYCLYIICWSKNMVKNTSTMYFAFSDIGTFRKKDTQPSQFFSKISFFHLQKTNKQHQTKKQTELSQEQLYIKKKKKNISKPLNASDFLGIVLVAKSGKVHGLGGTFSDLSWFKATVRLLEASTRPKTGTGGSVEPPVKSWT